MSELWMILGFAMAAYSIVANDSIQTLGTFLSSNEKRPWWILWIFVSGILVVTVTWGWMANGGDPAFGRLTAEGKNIPFPATMSWLFIVPPLVLVFFTRAGIPVSTSLLVLTAFKGLTAQQLGKDSKGVGDLFASMMKKSLVGYGIAFVVGLLVFLLVLHVLEKKVKNDDHRTVPGYGWVIFQWCSTGFLWSMWLVQDLANVFCYLPRQLTWWGLALSLGGMVILQGILIHARGGKIQNIVTTKSNTLDVRSACFIDLFYGLVLLFFKVDYIPQLFAYLGMEVPWPEQLPMSTTWVFLGLLAGREIGLAIRMKHTTKGQVSSMVFSDAGKAFIGSVVSVMLALALPLLANKLTPAKPAEQQNEQQLLSTHKELPISHFGVPMTAVATTSTREL